MIERVVVVPNELGLHARPAAQVVRLAAQFTATIELVRDGSVVNGKSIMGVMMLAAEQGASVAMRAEGAAAEAAVAAAAQALETAQTDADRAAHDRTEAEQAANAFGQLGGKLRDLIQVRVPGLEDEERWLVVVQKLKPTQARFPRQAGTPSKNPL